MRPFELSTYEVTFAQWAACVEGDGCGGYMPLRDAHGAWRESYGPNHPVFMVSWGDALSYVAWLSEETGERYRLPSEAEWEYAARAGSNTKYHFGDNPAELCHWGNVADTAYIEHKHYMNYPPADCTDGYVYAAPVGAFRPNAFGLYDMVGNVSEWTQDCYNWNYPGAPKNAPTDGGAWETGNCSQRVWRGGSWAAGWEMTQSHARLGGGSYTRGITIGFRVARTLRPSEIRNLTLRDSSSSPTETDGSPGN